MHSVLRLGATRKKGSIVDSSNSKKLASNKQFFLYKNNNLLFGVITELTPWTPWTPCSKTCGSGEKTRKRECKYPDNRDSSPSNPCGNAALFEREICNPQKCPIYTEWSEWSKCSVSCGGGKQSKERSCVLPPISGNCTYV